MFIPLQNSSNQLPEISNSLRFDGSNDYLYRVPNANATNQNVGTISMWIKRSKLGVAQSLLDCYLNAGVRTTFYFYADDTLQISYSNAGTAILTAAKFRDPSAWYHLVYQHNIGLPRLWINGVEAAYTTQTNLGTYACALGYNAAAFGIGAAFNGTTPFDGYIANVCVVVGQSKAPTDFAYTDPNGQWRSLKKSDLQALASAGDNNSFFLPFDNGASTTTLGNDASSKGNNWTLTNMVRDGSVNDCWSYDTPTNNFATLSPINRDFGTGTPAVITGLTNGNLSLNYSATAWDGYRSTMAVSTGKWYVEMDTTAGGTYPGNCGLQIVDAAAAILGAAIVSAVPASTGQTVAIAVDLDAGTYTTYQANAVISSSSISIDPSYTFRVVVGNAPVAHVNFGQRPVASGQWYQEAGGYFRYAPPTGYKALCTKNLPAPSITKPKAHFDVAKFVGTGSAQPISVDGNGSALVLQPDLVWVKARGEVASNRFVDSVRGVNKVLYSNQTAVETTESDVVTSFNTNGFTGGGANAVTAGYSGVAWLWKAGGAPVTNTSGTITSQVSANPAAGFSVVTYSGTGSAGTIGHGLSVAPQLIFAKARNAANGWGVGCKHAGSGWNAYLSLQLTSAVAGGAMWNNTDPTSSVFSVGGAGWGINESSTTNVAYCFAEVAGFSKIGKYTGNGSADGPFVWCGFRPKYVLIKRSDASGDWSIYDAARDPYNVMPDILFPNLANAETGGYAMDFLASGFKLRSSAASNANTSGGTYIFMAFAEAPFKYANAR